MDESPPVTRVPSEERSPGGPRSRLRDRIRAAWHEHSEAKEKNQYERVHNKVLRLHHVLKGKRDLKHREQKSSPVGKVTVSLLGGHFYTPRPYFILELDGNEERTPTAMTSNPDWQDNPLSRFTFPVYDAGSDLRIFLFDEYSHHHERCRGRVIIPLRSLCTKGLFCMPKPTSISRFRVMPAAGQHGEDPEARFREAVPGVPGTGMVKPDQEIGVLSLQLQLELTAPGARTLGLLAAYAQLPAGGFDDEDENESSSSEDESCRKDTFTSVLSGESRRKDTFTSVLSEEYEPHCDRRPSSKIIRAYSMRLKRCLDTAYVFKQPWCFLLPFLWYSVCFHMAAFMMPWVLLSLFLANGILGYLHPEDRTQDMIFWEDSIGPNRVPRGLKKLRRIYGHVGFAQKALIKVTTVLERRQHAFDFTDPPVTIVAFGFLLVVCIIISLILYMFTFQLIVFILGLLALAPFLKKACSSNKARQCSVLDADTGSDQEELDGKRHRKTRCRLHILQVGARMLRNVLSRVPDGGDVAHEYFCTAEQRLR